MSQQFNFNLYEELEVPKTATAEEIKKSYKKLAMKWHPDKNKDSADATEKFQRISHAYSILSDPKKKAHYDKYGTVDDDNFNFEEFMKGFHFDFPFDIFDGDFGKKMEQMMTGGILEGRHSMKLMYIRKQVTNEFPKIEDEEPFNKFIYGNGRGLESTKGLEFWATTQEETDWVTDEEDKNQKEEDDEDIEEELEDDDEDFEEEVMWGKPEKGSKKKKKKKGANNPFGMFGMGMEDMFMGANKKETEKMMRDFEKMMFGGGGGPGGAGMNINMDDLDEMFGAMGGMPGFPGFPGAGGGSQGKKGSKRKKKK